jgi:hypothetical protein
MSHFMLTTAFGVALVFGTAVLAHDGYMQHQSSQGASASGNSFDAQMGRAMVRMDRDMAVPPSGNYDGDFAAMMIPHHQGAVDMARIELQFGKDPVLRRLAQAIIVEQLQEIDVMKRELQQLAPVPGPSDHDHGAPPIMLKNARRLMPALSFRRRHPNGFIELQGRGQKGACGVVSRAAARGRGRDEDFSSPPAQILACAANAPGSSLGSDVVR